MRCLLTIFVSLLAINAGATCKLAHYQAGKLVADAPFIQVTGSQADQMIAQVKDSLMRYGGIDHSSSAHLNLIASGQDPQMYAAQTTSGVSGLIYFSQNHAYSRIQTSYGSGGDNLMSNHNVDVIFVLNHFNGIKTAGANGSREVIECK